jgi:hypothetical protein
MYTPAERDSLRESLIAIARADNRITGAAVTGSAAVDRTDRWSDVDLAFGVATTADFDQTIADWTELMYVSNGASHHFDVPSGNWIYRVFLLANTLQVDLAFAPVEHFGALAPTFRLIFGNASEQRQRPRRDAANLTGWSWLYGLHARSSLARGRYWQAEYMISAMRDHVLALACARLGLPTSEGRGFDDLPSSVTAPLLDALGGSLDAGRLSQSFIVVAEALIAELLEVDRSLAERLADPLRELSSGNFNRC